MSASSLAENKTLRILSGATRDGYGVVSPVVYNLSHIVGSIRAAERKRAPLILELFPWGVTSTDGLLVRAAAQAAAHASVPVSVHLDHATDESMIRRAVADLPFDSIMVDMSHHARAENLARTGRLAALCRARGIAVEGEPGRIEGGEDGIAAAEVEAVLTTAEDVDDFLAAGVDVLAPAIGNVHGAYGELGPRIDMARLDRIRERVDGRMSLALHGTTGIPQTMLQEIISRGVSKINVNKAVLGDYLAHLGTHASQLPLTKLTDDGIELVQKSVERYIDITLSAGKA